MTNLNIRDICRSADVDRWGIVSVDKRQSVAEHSYLVAMISLEVCDYFGVGDANYRQKILWHALSHDLAEVLTGDIASPLKEILNQDAREQLEDFEHSIYVFGEPVGDPGQDMFKRVVKVADLVEAIVFLQQHGKGHHAEQVRGRLFEKLTYMLGERDAEALVLKVADGPMVTLDDIVEARNEEA